MSKRSTEDEPTIGELMTGAGHAGKKSKRAKYDDSGDFSAAAGDEWGKNKDKEGEGGGSEIVNKQKASFGLSGALAKDEVTGKVVNGVTLKYNPPADRILPSVQWRFFVFKGDEVLDTLFVHRKDNFLLGSNDKVCDILMEHGSISGQHAVLQYRRVPYSGKKEKFMGSMVCKPYLMDLDSTNGTILNKEKIDGRRYYELRKGDVISFGESTREYVFMVEKSKKK